MTHRLRHQITATLLALCVVMSGFVGINPTLHRLVEHAGDGSAHVHRGGATFWQRRAALGTLTRRSEWSGQLLGAIEAKTIPASDLGPHVWQQLRQSRDRRIAAQAARLADADKPISADRAAVVKRLLPVAKLKGDAERGKVGPELAGIGARDRADILMEILDLSGTKHSVQRKDIASLESSPLSIMPTGFEQIPESDLAGLLEYLAHSNHPPGK